MGVNSPGEKPLEDMVDVGHGPAHPGRDYMCHLPQDSM